MDKYLSVITNFGCHYSCPYCIVKNNHLNIPKSTIDGLDNLAKEIENNKCNWVSISGGGDPLWEHKQHIDWYKKFLNIVPSDVKIELHTSLIDVENAPYYLFDRVVYHLHNFEQLKTIKKFGDEIVRVVFVVTEDFTEDLINKIAVYCHNSESIDELSFRQMVDDNYKETDYCKNYLKEGHQKLWWYIEQCDYNIYYVENKIYTEYRKIGEQCD
jgi:organic radical activating enzyme